MNYGTRFGNEYEGEMRKRGEEKKKVWRLGKIEEWVNKLNSQRN